MAGVGQGRAAGVALDEADADLTLESRDLLGDRGWGVRQRVGRGRERAVASDLAQDLQAAEVEHEAELNTCTSYFN